MNAGYPAEFAEAYLASQSDSYNHPNGAIEPRIPGIFDYYIAAEEEMARAVAGEKSVAGGARRGGGEVGRDHGPQRPRRARSRCTRQRSACRFGRAAQR